jgi:hypothetical protein
MSSEQPPSHNPSFTRQGPPETLHHPPSRGGVRMLLGLPVRDSGALSTVALTAPLGRHRYGQSPLPESEGSNESFGETSAGEGVIDETEPPRDFPRAPLRDGTLLSRAMRENAADAGSMATEPSAERREHTHLVIPGVSTHGTAFPTLSQTADTPTISMEGEPRDAIPQQAAPLNAPASLPHAREMTTSDVELLTRLEQLVTESARAQKNWEERSRSSAPRSPRLTEQMNTQNGERGGPDLAQRFEHLQRVVSELAAAVSSQAAQMRGESEVQRRERKIPPERRLVVQRMETSSTTPRAFWERSRLGRLHVRAGR